MGSLRHGPTTWGYFEGGRLDAIESWRFSAASALESMSSSARPAESAHDRVGEGGLARQKPERGRVGEAERSERGGVAVGGPKGGANPLRVSHVDELVALLSPRVRAGIARRGIALWPMGRSFLTANFSRKPPASEPQ